MTPEKVNRSMRHLRRLSGTESAEWPAKGEQAILVGPMNPTSESSTEEVLAGLVERVTFHNAENGFCVLRAKARGYRDLVTVVSHAAVVSAGE